MRLKAVIEGNRIRFLEGEYNFPVPVVAEVDIPDKTLLSLPGKVHPVTRQIRQLMGYIRSEAFDWKETWHKHLEEKYGSECAD